PAGSGGPLHGRIGHASTGSRRHRVNAISQEPPQLAGGAGPPSCSLVPLPITPVNDAFDAARSLYSCFPVFAEPASDAARRAGGNLPHAGRAFFSVRDLSGAALSLGSDGCADAGG